MKRASLFYAIDIEQVGDFLRVMLTTGPENYALEAIQPDFVKAGEELLARAGVEPIGYHLSKGIGGWFKVTMLFPNTGDSLSKVVAELNRI